MFWSLNSLEEQTFGQLIAAFRRRRGLSQQDVAPLLARFGFRFAPQLSLLEGGTWPTQPDRALIHELAGLYTLSPFEESCLLRQADLLPSGTEQQSILMRFGTTLLDFSSPACVLNAHWQLVAWNETFAALYDGSERLETPSSRFPFPESALQAASHAPAAPSSPTTSSTSSAPSASPSSASERRGRSTPPAAGSPAGLLTLQENLNFLLLLFGRTSRLRALLEAEEWTKLAQFFLIRFWRTTLPLLNPHWYTPAEPAWLRQLEAELRALPVPENQEFAELSDRIRHSLEADGGWADPHSQLSNNWLQDRLLFRQLGVPFHVIPTLMSDARFLFLQFQRIHLSEPLVATRQSHYLL